MATWADEYVTLLEDCEKRSEKLTDWELGFVDSPGFMHPARFLDRHEWIFSPTKARKRWQAT